MQFDIRCRCKRLVELVLACACGCFGLVAAWSAPAEITRFADFYSLPAEQVQKNVPVRIGGVIVCYDLQWGQLYINDGSLTTWFSPQLFQTNLQPGMNVELTGGTTLTPAGSALTNLHLNVLGKKALPPAKRLDISQLGADYGQWVETRGWIRVAETSSSRLSLILQRNGQSCLVYVMTAAAVDHEGGLGGCEVWVRGIDSSKVVSGKLEAATIFAPDLNAITVINPPTATAPLPVTSIESLLDRELGPWTNELVHLKGVMISHTGGSLVIKDPTGTIRAQVIQGTETKTDERIDLWGYLTVLPGETILRSAYFKKNRRPLETTQFRKRRAHPQPPLTDRKSPNFRKSPNCARKRRR